MKLLFLAVTLLLTACQQPQPQPETQPFAWYSQDGQFASSEKIEAVGKACHIEGAAHAIANPGSVPFRYVFEAYLDAVRCIENHGYELRKLR